MPSALDVLRAELRAAAAGLADLQAEFAALADTEVVAVDDEHDSEGSTVGYERARVASLVDQTSRRLADLEAAVGRVAAGTYGTCESCGGDIGADRLAALPAAPLCVTCSRSR